MSEETPQGNEENTPDTDGTVGEDSPYQLAVSKCRALMTEGKKDEAVDEYNEAIAINTDAENEELSLLSDQLDAMEDGKPFEFPEAETSAEESEEEAKGGEETKLGDLPKWHDKAGQQLESDELKSILKELDINFNILTGRKKLQKKFDDYNTEKGYEKSEDDVKAEEVKNEEEKAEKSTVKKDRRGKKAKEVNLDECIESCQKTILVLQAMENQERENGRSSRRFRRAWQTINAQVVRKSLRRD